jgi:hypothetical protein
MAKLSCRLRTGGAACAFGSVDFTQSTIAKLLCLKTDLLNPAGKACAK